MPFERSFHVSWAHLDANQHMKNTAYLDLCVDARMMYFTEHGFPAREFERLQVGPVVMRDEVDYYRELRLLETVRVTFTLAGISDNGSRFRIRNEFFRSDGAMAARVTSQGGWLDLAARKLVAPPAALFAALNSVERSADFTPLESSVRKA